MSRRAHRAPFALTSGGDVLINVAMYDVAKELDVLLAVARRQPPGTVFIGVVMSPAEVAFALSELHHAHRDASAWIVGGRQHQKRRPRRKCVKDDEKPRRATSSRRRPSSP